MPRQLQGHGPLEGQGQRHRASPAAPPAHPVRVLKNPVGSRQVRPAWSPRARPRMELEKPSAPGLPAPGRLRGRRARTAAPHGGPGRRACSQERQSALGPSVDDLVDGVPRSCAEQELTRCDEAGLPIRRPGQPSTPACAPTSSSRSPLPRPSSTWPTRCAPAPPVSACSGTKEELAQTINTQPCVFAADLACARALVARGVTPDVVAGFSLGEVAALTFAGAYSDEEGFELVCRRAELMADAAEKNPGAMRAVREARRRYGRKAPCLRGGRRVARELQQPAPDRRRGYAGGLREA